MIKAIKNSWTTIMGILAGVGIYASQVGAKYPATNEEWIAFVLGLVMAIWGATQKDGKTGSAP